MSFKVMDRRCDECLFSDDKIVSPERKADVLANCAVNDNHFTCHKVHGTNEDVCCRGFYDTQPPCQLTRIAQRLNMVEFVSTDEWEEKFRATLGRGNDEPEGR